MLYENEFTIHSFDVKPLFVNRNAFTVNLNSKFERKPRNRYSVAYAFKPLSFITSIFGMNPINYRKSEILKPNIWNKIYCLVIIVIYIGLTIFVKSRMWRVVNTDVPYMTVTKIYVITNCLEVMYDIFMTSFSNSSYYISLLNIFDIIDDHFQITRKHFIKRRIFAIVLALIPLILTSFTFLILKLEFMSTLSYLSLTLITLQGVTCIFFVAIIYIRTLNFNNILFEKIHKISSFKKLVFKDDLITCIVKKMLSDPIRTESNNGYCWFELMQIYDKISECICLFNKIYAKQIFLMLNTWLLSTISAICRTFSPMYKNSHAHRVDLYFYVFINLRPLLVTGISERLIQERKKTLLILKHILIHHDLDPEYRSQIKTMLMLAQTRKWQLSAVLSPVNIPIMVTFAAQIVSYSVLFIQNFYIKFLLQS